MPVVGFTRNRVFKVGTYPFTLRIDQLALQVY